MPTTFCAFFCAALVPSAAACVVAAMIEDKWVERYSRMIGAYIAGGCG